MKVEPVPVSVDPAYPGHMKLLSAGPVSVLAMAMDVAGLCFCARSITDGFIPDAAVGTLVDLSAIRVVVSEGVFEPVLHEPTAREVADTLTHVGRWERVPGGYSVHDYLDWNPSREDISNPRRRAGRVRAARARREAGRFATDTAPETTPGVASASMPGAGAVLVPDLVRPAETLRSAGGAVPGAPVRALGTSGSEKGSLTASTSHTSESLEPEIANAPAAAELFAVLARATGTEPGHMTPREARATGVALSEIRRALPDVTADEIARRAAIYRAHFRGAALTANALAKHWSRCARPPSNGQRPPEVEQAYQRFLQGVGE